MEIDGNRREIDGGKEVPWTGTKDEVKNGVRVAALQHLPPILQR